jgi:multidrug efflux pump subunit AcrB
MVAATLATQAALATILPDMPPGTRFQVRRSDPTIFPVLGIALTSKTLDQEALRQLAELKVRPALTAVAGVAGVDLLGGSPREFAVEVDPGRAASLGLNLGDVAAALGKSNEVRGLGRFEDRHRLYLVLIENRIASVADVEATPVKAGDKAGGGIVTLGQIATVRPSVEPSFMRVTSNGKDAVLVNIRQTLAGDTVKIVKDVDARLKDAGLPPSVIVTRFYDQSELVTGAAGAVRDAILLGAVLAGLVLVVFLRSGRLMLITGLMLPAVLAATCLILFALGMSFNMMTLGGMAAAVGLIVDDAVVMLEHIMRRMQEGEAKDPKSLLAAAAEMGVPTVRFDARRRSVVFLPLAFISGVTGGFFKALALTMVAALGGVACCMRGSRSRWSSAHWLREKRCRGGGARRTGFMGMAGEGIHGRAGGPACWRARDCSPVILGARVWRCAGYMPPGRRCPSGFMPVMDEGGFILDYKAQPGAALADTDRHAEAGRRDHRGDAGGGELFAADGRAARGRPDGGRRGRLFHPAEGRLAAGRSKR